MHLYSKGGNSDGFGKGDNSVSSVEGRLIMQSKPKSVWRLSFEVSTREALKRDILTKIMTYIVLPLFEFNFFSFFLFKKFDVHRETS